MTLRLEATFGELALHLLVGRPLPPLPPPLPPPSAPASVVDLWRLVEARPREVRSVGALASTFLVVRGNLRSKLADVFPATAGRGTLPDGFRLLERPASDPSRPPLVASYHPPAPGHGLVFLLHGLYDSKTTGYIGTLSRYLASQGFGVLAPDLRWHGVHADAPWPLTLGVEEARDVLDWERATRDLAPGAPRSLVGVSFGALVTMHTLAADAERVFRGAVGISPPIALESTFAFLDRTPLVAWPPGRGVMPFVLRKGLRRRLRALGQGRLAKRRRPLAAMLAAQPPPADGQSLLALGTPEPLLGRVQVPLLLLAAANDPLFHPGASRELAAAAQANPWVHVVELPHGGHVGCLATAPAFVSTALSDVLTLAPALVKLDVSVGGSGG
jgi:uncharacterized protein